MASQFRYDCQNSVSVSVFSCGKVEMLRVFANAVAEHYFMEFESIVELDLIECHCRKHRKRDVEFEVCHLKDGLWDRTGVKKVFWLEVIHLKDVAEVGEIVWHKRGSRKLSIVLRDSCHSLGCVNDSSQVYCLGYTSRVRVQGWSVHVVDSIDVKYIIPLLYMQQWCLSFILYE